jgi:hypothetical protein
MLRRWRIAKDYIEEYGVSKTYAKERASIVTRVAPFSEEYYQQMKELNGKFLTDLEQVKARIREQEAHSYDMHNVSAEFAQAKIELAARYHAAEISHEEFTVEFDRINKQYPEDWANLQLEFQWNHKEKFWKESSGYADIEAERRKQSC